MENISRLGREPFDVFICPVSREDTEAVTVEVVQNAVVFRETHIVWGVLWFRKRDVFIMHKLVVFIHLVSIN